MLKIFKFHYENLLRGYMPNLERGKESLGVLNNMKKYIPRYGEFLLLKKFPGEDLKRVAKMECNTEWSKKVEEIENSIESAKKLRLTLGIKEKNVCFNCSKKDKCKFFEKIPETKNDKGTKEIASIMDLQIVLHGLYKNGLDIENGTFNHDKSNSQKQNTISDNKLSSNRDKTDKLKNSHKFNVESLEKRFDNQIWKSGSILTELMNDTLNDLANNNGVAFKTLINAFIESKEKESVEIVGKKEVEKAVNNLDQMDPYVKLLKDLKLSKNRKEKKQLLAKFNQTVGFGWGEYRRIFKERVKPEEEEMDTKTSNNTHDPNILKRKLLTNNNPNNNNTAVMTEGKLERIQNVNLGTKAITQHFSHKIDIKKQKAKLLESQQNMSLLFNKNEEGLIEGPSNKSFVKIPGDEYRKAIQYVGKDKRNELQRLILDKRNTLSVDLKSVVDKKQNKIDRTLEKSKKFTLMKHLEKDVEAKRLEGYLDNHQVALESFENQLRLEGDASKDENKLVSLKNSEIIDLKNVNDIVESIQFEKNSLDSNVKGLEFYRQTNLVNQEKIKKGQELAKVKKVLKNKHIYKANHYYNNTNNEHLMFEKDSDISKAIQFEKSIYKK